MSRTVDLRSHKSIEQARATGSGDFRKRGAFFTPSNIASALAARILRAGSVGTVLEPSCGEGELIDAILDAAQGAVRSVVGFEVDAVTANFVKDRFSGDPEVEVHTEDFLSAPIGKLFDAILANPPFVRHHSLTNQQRKQVRRLAEQFDVAQLSQRASLWVYFLLQSLRHLRVGGQIAFVLPAEYGFADYSRGVRAMIESSFEEVSVESLPRSTFAGAQVSTLILHASGFRGMRRGGISTDLVDRSEERFEPLSTWGSIRIGTVSGANGYFLLNQTQVNALRLRSSDLIRIVPPRRQMRTQFGSYLSSDWTADRDADAYVYAFYPITPFERATSSYVAAGESQGIPRGYKARRRRVWWRLENLVSGDLLLPYVSGSAPALIHNALHLPHINSMHAVHLIEDLKGLGAVAALASANSRTALSMERVGRVYGGGGLKLEVSASRSILVPNAELVKAFALEWHNSRISTSHLRPWRELRKQVDNVLFGRVLGWASSRVRGLQDEFVEVADARRLYVSRKEWRPIR